MRSFRSMVHRAFQLSVMLTTASFSFGEYRIIGCELLPTASGAPKGMERVHTTLIVSGIISTTLRS